MSFQMYDRLEAAAAQLREQQEKILGAQAELAAMTTTVVSKNRMVSVTVGGDGTLTAATGLTPPRADPHPRVGLHRLHLRQLLRRPH